MLLCIMKQQTKEAKEGGAFAEQQYEKYRQATKEAKENYMSGLKKHDIERQELDEERELIKEIMRFIGVLHDVKATEKSIAAGGRDSIKDEETGVSDYYGEYKANSRAALKAKVPLSSLS
jgi:CRISPR/Cas system-associated endonuclease Cas3-HD